ncbi:MAG TPA: hypothetical protein VHK88_14120 [Aquihabitans sp.]|jgi:hypothetical protein|nr:hypothetical protein [Aquihabitans sp.]
MKLSSPFGRDRRERDDRRRSLRRGEAVTVACRLRRTSARGWGPWTPAELTLGPVPDGPVGWHADDPIAVGLPATRGPVDARFDDIDDVWSRDVRFRTEAFWGMDGGIIVLAAERATTEVAVPPELLGPLLERLQSQLGFEPSG